MTEITGSLFLLLAAALPTPVAFALAFAVRDGREFLTGSLFLLLAAALPTPVAFALAFAVRDGREFLTGSLFLLLAAALAALAYFFTGSLLAAVPGALVPVALLAHARFLGAHRAPPPRAGELGYASARPATDTDAELPLEEVPPDALHLGMAFVGDVLETADRIGELRHKRRLRPLARQKAERELAAPPAAPARVPELHFRARPRRDPVRLLPPE